MSQLPPRQGITRRRGLAFLAAAAATPMMPWVARAQAKTLVLGVQFGLPYLGFLVAESRGLFKQQAQAKGADVTFELKRLSGPTALTEGLLSNTVHIAALGMLPLLIGYNKSRGSYDMGGVSGYWKGTYTIFANDPAIRSVADIRPTDKIAVPGPTSSQALVLRRAAAKLFGPGEARKFDQQLVSLPHPDAVAALTTGNTVQVYFATSPYAEVLAQSPNVHVIGTSREFNPPGMSNGVVAALAATVRDNPKAVAAFLAALDEANRFIPANPEETARIYFAAEPSPLTDAQKLAVIRNNLDEYAIAPNGVIETADFMVKLGQLPQAPARWQDVFFPPINTGAGS